MRTELSAEPKLRLFCLPYAGGSASIFQTWAKHFPEAIDICPIQLPGRGMRIHETPIHHFPSLIKTIVQESRPYLNVPFAFFGHSLGGLIAFEISHQLYKECLPLPLHLLVSGCASPTRQNKRRVLSTLPEHEFIDELRRLNGTPEGILNNHELMALLLPVLRADFSLLESYRYQPHPQLLRCPITAFGGLEDQDIELEQLRPWEDETYSRFVLHVLPGDHFFLHQSETELLTLLKQQLHPFIHKAA